MPDPRSTNPEPQQQGVTVKDALGAAPIVYFEGAPNYGYRDGIINVTLAANRYLSNAAGGIDRDVIAIAHLRGNLTAALALRKALDDAILLATPTGDGNQKN